MTTDVPGASPVSSEGLGPLVERLSDIWHHADCRRAGEFLKLQQAEIARLLGERDVLLSVLHECDKVISALEPESADEDEALRALLRAIKRLTLLSQADERDLLATHGA